MLDFSRIRNDAALTLIAGPCVVESESLVMHVAETMTRLCQDLGIHYIFKASFDKANRTSAGSFRGPGVEEGLRILSKVRAEFSVPVLTDVHEYTKLDEVASVVDIMQTPAFLVRQTDFMQNVARQGIPVNIKKGQFQAPWDMAQVVEKCRATGNQQLMLCDRGTSFGYNTLISDMRGLEIMQRTGCPVIFDATHSVQQPGGQGATSGGQREFVPTLARAATAVGIAGLFMEVHPDPEQALSDGPNMLPLSQVPDVLRQLLAIDAAVKP